MSPGRYLRPQSQVQVGTGPWQRNGCSSRCCLEHTAGEEEHRQHVSVSSIILHNTWEIFSVTLNRIKCQG